jgi:glycosyltransferase involved in cell wall biosynthesis
MIHVVIPARNEEEALPDVLAALPWELGLHVMVVDNGSTDGTAAVARRGGAAVVVEPRVGYGAACLAALDGLRNEPDEDVVVFLDADGSDDPGLLPVLVEPLWSAEADLVLASRTMVPAEPGALTSTQRFGNWLSCKLIALLWGVHFTDLAPYRAVQLGTVRALEMQAPDFGWTVEMQIRAARLGLRIREVPSRYRRRLRGRSKVSGTVWGSVRAGITILGTIARELLAGRRWEPHRTG